MRNEALPSFENNAFCPLLAYYSGVHPLTQANFILSDVIDFFPMLPPPFYTYRVCCAMDIERDTNQQSRIIKQE